MVLLKALHAFAEFLYMLPAWALTGSLCNSDTHLAVQNAEPFPARTHVSDFMARRARRRSGLPHHQPAARNLSSPPKCGTQGTFLQTTKAALVPLHREREKRSNFRLCSECVSSAHIGNSTVPRSQCDLPVAHLLASVKCKSLRASVSAQYSQEHEGSCAEGRVRAGRQRGALSPPLSGVYRLKNLLIWEPLQGGSAHPNHPELHPCLILGAGVGSHLSVEALASMLWIHRLLMLGWGARGLGGGTSGWVWSQSRGAVAPGQDLLGDGSHPAPVPWCDGSSPWFQSKPRQLSGNGKWDTCCHGDP